ncbi:hypothetical protein Cgig2_026029 [Carnegiea gigantea]|uniref:DUF3615 domain-containing protein n=1 Tax=Carnegiea gigantea TaxID=171969 RepID=A0A9Q1KLY5_9CARY|nr:hypothetical protein Cgig2_026029 [Carnegiea gigantea]
MRRRISSPPMFTHEEILENLKIQDNNVAAAGLKHLNKTLAVEGPPMTALRFRTPLGRLYHGNFVAKPSDDPNAKSQLFFIECKLAPVTPVQYQVIKCLDLGPVDMAAARCRRSCQLCRFLLFDPLLSVGLIVVVELSTVSSRVNMLLVVSCKAIGGLMQLCNVLWGGLLQLCNVINYAHCSPRMFRVEFWAYDCDAVRGLRLP